MPAKGKRYLSHFQGDALKASTGNGFVPAHGASLSVLLYHTRSGTFGTLSGSPSYTVSYTATAANVVYP